MPRQGPTLQMLVRSPPGLHTWILHLALCSSLRLTIIMGNFSGKISQNHKTVNKKEKSVNSKVFELAIS